MLYLTVSRVSASEGGFVGDLSARRESHNQVFISSRSLSRWRQSDNHDACSAHSSANATDTQIHPGSSIRLVIVVIVDGSLPRRVLLTRQTHRPIPLPLLPSSFLKSPKTVSTSCLSVDSWVPSYPFGCTRESDVYRFSPVASPRSIVPIHHLLGNKIQEIKLSMCRICAIFETSHTFRREGGSCDVTIWEI